MLDRIIQKARDFADLMGRPYRERRAAQEHRALMRARALRYFLTSDEPEWMDYEAARWVAHHSDCPECRDRGIRLVRDGEPGEG